MVAFDLDGLNFKLKYYQKQLEIYLILIKVINIQLPPMQLPKIRNFKLKKLEKVETDSIPDSSVKNKLDRLAQVPGDATDMLQDDAFSRNHLHMSRTNQIVISNRKTNESSNYEGEFTPRMDPRDKVITIPFHFTFYKPHSTASSTQDFLSSELFAAISNRIEEYLVRMLEIVVSVSFNELMEGKLKENECKDYASKNILLNVHTICRETCSVLKEHCLITGKEKEVELALTEIADSTLTNSVKSLAPYYPQAPPTGGTPRIRQALLSIDRNYNSELDFLSTQKLKLERNADGDYTEYIMKVVNQAILVTGEIQDDSNHLTLFQKFKDFTENLTWLVKDDAYARLMTNVISTIDSSRRKTQGNDLVSIMKQDALKATLSKRKELINNFFREPTIANATEAVRMEGEREPHFSEEARERQILAIKSNRELEAGQKLPSGLQTFSKNDIKDRNFTAKHSSVLRVITKWAENLQGIFENAEKFVLNRNYPFTTLSGKSIYPTSDLKQRIFDQIIKLKEKKNRIHHDLVAKNKLFQAEFLSKEVGEDQITRFIKRYTETRIVASKLNTLIIKFMQEYVSELINLLIEAGRFEEEKKEYSKGETEYINLVSFRIGDLLRARIHLNEAACIRTLHTLYLLDEHQDKEAPFFKLVRVKNKLDQKDNNVLINFLFKGKLQCELQISSNKMEGKEQKYYAFSHFLYELSRSSFGILSECAIIVSQHDPIASSPSFFQAKKFMQSNKDQPNSSSQVVAEKSSNIFICVKCGRLIMNQNKHIFIKTKATENVCNQCFINFFNQKDFKSLQIEDNKTLSIEGYLSNPQLSQWMSQLVENVQTRKLKHYGQLQNNKSSTLLLSINQKYNNEVDYFLLIYEQTQFQYYLIHLNDAILLAQNVRDESIEVKNISARIKQSQPFKELTYSEATLNKINMADIIKANKKIPSGVNVVSRLYQMEEKARSIIAKAAVENILRNKNETIAFNKSPIKMEAMNEQAASAPSISHIEYIFAENMQLKAIPQWVSNTDKLKLINLNSNTISDASLIQDKHQLKELYLSSNLIKQINCSQLKKLEKLDLSHNQLTLIECQQMACLIELNLETNLFSSFDLKRFPALRHLNLSTNQLQELNTDHTPDLQRLLLNSNRFTKMVTPPPKLKEFHMNYNSLGQIEDQKLPKCLTVLSVSNNNITKIKLQNMPALVTFYASYNTCLEDVVIKNAPKLKELSMDGCNLESLAGIEFPPEMQWIFLNNNRIKDLELNNIKCLENLNLTGNQLQKLQLKNTQVKILTLFQNGLTDLDNFLLPHTIQRLFLKSNSLTSVSLQNFPELEILNLQSNQLTSLQIEGMPKLKELALDYNCLNSIDNINIPIQLERLFVRSNNLEKLNISDLRELKLCILDGNPLTRVNLTGMPKLQQIGLMNTKIKSHADIDLPNTIKKVFLHNNFLQEVTYANMPNLEMVVVPSNQLQQALLENLPNLNAVYFNSNSLTKVTLKKLPKIQLLSFPYNSLQEIALIDMPFLKTLHLNSNKLTELNLEDVSLIQTVNVSDNLLKEISLNSLPLLNTIDISSNIIQTCHFENLASLKSLNIGNNCIKKMTAVRLKSLQSLDLGYNPIQTLVLQELNRLETISLYKAQMTEWNIEDLPALKYVTLFYAQIDTLSFLNVPSLETLNITSCQFKAINLNGLPNIQTITADSSQLPKISLCKMKELNTASFSTNQIDSIEISELPKLAYLTINYCSLSQLAIKDSPKITELSIMGNKIKEIDLSGCEEISTLILAENPITDLANIKFNKNKISLLNLTQIQAEIIQIKDYPLLETVLIINCASMTSAVFQNCPLLATLGCNYNSVLTQLTLKGLPALLTVNLQDDPLTKCDIQMVNPVAQLLISKSQVEKVIKEGLQQEIQIVNSFIEEGINEGDGFKEEEYLQ